MTYTGNIYKDFTVTLPNVVAETVAETLLVPLNRHDEIKKLAELLHRRFEITYHVNRNFGERLERKERSQYGARDAMYTWMEHWAKAWILNPDVMFRYEKRES